MLELREVTVELQGRRILERVSLRTEPGKIFAVVGPNGAGKTVLLRTAAGLLKPVEGEVLLGGTPLHQISPSSRALLLSYLPQSGPGGWEFFTEEVISMGLYGRMGWRWWFRGEERSLVEEVVEELSLKELLGKRLDQLSSGERQRLLLGMLFVRSSSLYLLDEPVSNLDLRYQWKIYSLIKRMAEKGASVLVAEHQIHLCRHFCDRVFLLKAGSVSGEGLPSELLTPERIKELFDVEGAAFIP